MKLTFKEHPADYSKYEFPYQVYGELEKADKIEDAYSQGFLQSRISVGTMYLARNIRINLKEFNLNSENRRIQKKTEYLDLEIQSLKTFEYDYEIGKFAQEYYKTRFQEKVMSVQKIKWLFESGAFSDVIIYTDKTTNKIIGYCPIVLTSKILHYAYPFYDLTYYKQNIGMGMMLQAITHAKEKGLDYIYLGTCYTEASLYKTQFEGIEWFDGSGWNKDVGQLKGLIKTSPLDPHTPGTGKSSGFYSTIKKPVDLSTGSKVHFIGIAGKAMASVAIMMRENGWKVTGSDQNVFEPALSLLNKNGIEWKEGYDADRVKDADLIVTGGGPLMGNLENPEFTEAQKLGKKLYTFPQVLQEYVAKEESIVITGSYGKTTTTGLINWVLETLGENPSFMIGDVPIQFDTGVRKTDSKYSAIEGDEYVAAFGYDMEPKFIYYKPKYAILSAAKWDHMNVYPTEESYVSAYHKLTKLVKQNHGVLFICATGENNEKVLQEYDGEHVTYMLRYLKQTIQGEVDYIADHIVNESDKSTFDVIYRGTNIGSFSTKLIGNHNIENCLAAIAVFHHLGFDINSFKAGISTYEGIKRRQEIRGHTPLGALVIDDLAHSPAKAQATLEALRTRYSANKIISIYGPRESELQDRRVLDMYKGCFDLADEVLIPKIMVKKSTPKASRIYGKDMVEAIGFNARYMPIDEEIIKYLKSQDANTVIVFMSGGGWRGIVEALLDRRLS